MKEHGDVSFPEVRVKVVQFHYEKRGLKSDGVGVHNVDEVIKGNGSYDLKKGDMAPKTNVKATKKDAVE